MPENNQNSKTSIIRERVIECMSRPDLASIYASQILRDTQSKKDLFYLIKFIGMNQGNLTLSYIESAIKKISGFKDSASLYMMFYVLRPSFQIEVVEDIAYELIRLDNEYYLGKFAYYCRFIATHLGEIRTLKYSYRGIDDEWLENWMQKIKKQSLSYLAGIISDLEASGQPIKSPDDKIIKDREGFKPQFIVLHSAGAASPIERIAYNFLSPDTAPVSAHFVVTKDGRVFQFVDLKDAARTNGTSDDPSQDNYYGFSRHPFFGNTKENANNFTVNIECEEFGYKGTLNSQQYRAVLKTLARIHRECGIPIDRVHVLGHRDIAPFSKWYCPGDCYPINGLIRDFNATRPLPATPLNPKTLLYKF